uniref:BrnA antitoxin family protein n=1 Tax=Candidatus Electronema sp. TaxID=2698783 RepID=UPI004055A457
MTDEEIDYSDIPRLPKAFFERATLWHPKNKVNVTVTLDEDLLQWFKSASDDWEDRMQAALRLYVETHKAVSFTRP